MRRIRWSRFSTPLLVIAVMAGVESLIMVVLPYLPRPFGVSEAVLDTALLASIAGPLVMAIVRAHVLRIEGAEWRQMETRYAALLHGSSDAIVICDGDGRIRTFNAGAERVFDYRAEQVVGEPVHLLLPLDARDRHQAAVGQFTATEGTPRAVMADGASRMGRRADGTEFPVEVSMTRVLREGQVSLLAIVRDVTERIAREKELDAARERAEQSAAAKSEFLANMSHEIRTPMNAVVGLTGLLLDSPLSMQQREYMEIIRNSSDNLLVILNDILDYSKIEAGRLELEARPFRLDECVESAIELLGQRAAEKGLELLCEIEPGVPPVLVGDATRLRQVIVNLVSNAVKFTAQGEVVVSASATASEDGRHHVSLAVRDTGMGIPAERLDRLFQSFTQVDASTTRRFGGTGLGLVISRRLCTAMGGDVTVQSTVGQGTTFTASFHAAEAPEESCVTAPGVVFATITPGARVLVVDDNSTNRLILSRQLGRWAMRVVTAESGEEALAVLDSEHVDLVVTDIQMPGMDGTDLAREIVARRGAAAPPLIALTSLGGKPASGVTWQAFLAKPVRESVLRQAVAKALNQSRADTPDAASPTPTDRGFAARHPLRILVAEDNPVNQLVARAQLERLGYRADMVGNGSEAVDAVQTAHYDVVLMDVQMPVMDGLEATRAIRASGVRGAGIYVVALTASALESDRADCLAAGMNAVVTKPVKIEALKDALAQGAQAVAG